MFDGDLSLSPESPGWRLVRAIQAAQRGGGGRGAWRVELETRSLLATSGDADAWVGTDNPVAPKPTRRRMLGDIITRVPVTRSVGAIPYIRELGPTSTDDDAAATAEGSAKAEVEIQFEAVTGDESRSKKVTAWVPASDELFDDGPGLAAYVDGRLMYVAHVREEFQLLDGDGVGENLTGVRSLDDVQTQAFATSVNETIARSIEKVQLVDGSPTGIVIHPTSYRAGYLASPQFWEGLEQDVVVSRAVGANKALVGDFANAATIRERQSTVRYGDQHSDYLVTNKVAVVAELREVAMWHVPAHFVDADLA